MITLDTVPALTEPQPITLGMRVLNRVSRHIPGRLVRLKNAGPIVTFTFDDVPDTAATDGASLIEAAGARATFFVATSLFGVVTPHWRVATEEDVARLSGCGHEIGLHSHGHLPAALMDRKSFARDFDEASRRVARIAPTRNYAYPYGFASPLHRGTLSRRVRSSRTTHPGLNCGRVDPHFLRSQVLDQTLTMHDVRPRPSAWGCTPELLRHAVEGAENRGMALCTMDQALDACGLPEGSA